MKPIIGITSNIKEERLVTTGLDNVQSVMRAGGAPVILPNISDDEAVERFVQTFDGLLVTGGGDIDPTLFGEEPHPKLGEVCPERDVFEIKIITRFLELNKPILGLCRGCQMLNTAIGGDLYQDIYSQHDKALLQHYQKAPRTHPSHYIDVAENSLLYRIVQSRRIKVNSFHHQAVRRIGDGFEKCAESSDGIIEAIESTKHRFALGVQWHPENLVRGDDRCSLNLFQTFIMACSG